LFFCQRIDNLPAVRSTGYSSIVLERMEAEVVGEEAIAARIHWIRGQKVMLAHDLATLYGVATKRLNEQVKRNMTRFPEDFMFQLSELEWSNLKSQFATSRSWGGWRRQVCVAEDLSKQDGSYANAHVVAGLKARPHTRPWQRHGFRGQLCLLEG
jgi:hypothetical protein